MLLRIDTLMVTAVLALGLAGCASNGGVYGSPAGNGFYKERAGNVTEFDLLDRLPKVLLRHGYFIDTAEARHNDIVMMTQWRHRQPFTDEILLGATGARTRMHFRALWTGHMYSLTIEVENMIETRNGAWVHGGSGEDFTDYARELTSTVQLEIASGMRRH